MLNSIVLKIHSLACNVKFSELVCLHNRSSGVSQKRVNSYQTAWVQILAMPPTVTLGNSAPLNLFLDSEIDDGKDLIS